MEIRQQVQPHRPLSTRCSTLLGPGAKCAPWTRDNCPAAGCRGPAIISILTNRCRILTSRGSGPPPPAAEVLDQSIEGLAGFTQLLGHQMLAIDAQPLRQPRSVATCSRQRRHRPLRRHRDRDPQCPGRRLWRGARSRSSETPRYAGSPWRGRSGRKSRPWRWRAKAGADARRTGNFNRLAPRARRCGAESRCGTGKFLSLQPDAVGAVLIVLCRRHWCPRAGMVPIYTFRWERKGTSRARYRLF